MGIEIERRFLVKNMDKVNELVKQYTDSKKTIIQDYVYSDVLTAIRKRKIVKNDNEKYIYTIKTGFNSLSINEFEEEMTKEQYDSIKPDSSRWTIEKDRYIIWEKKILLQETKLCKLYLFCIDQDPFLN